MSASAPAAAPRPDGGEDLVMSVQSLTVKYGNVVALNDVSFSIPRGSVTGLIGPNGAGKTTLIDALTNYTSASSGSVVFEGQPTRSVRAHRLARRGLIRTFQSVELFDDLTVEENLAVASQPPSLLGALGSVFAGGRETRSENVEWALTVTELHDVVDRYPTELSHGQRKLVGVGRSLARRPSLLLLDEPAAGLDTAETLALGERLRRLPEHGVTVLLIDHDMGLVLGTCDRVMVLDFGNLIAAGTPAEIRADHRVVEAYLGSSQHSEATNE
jgi:branched-chain amino acid transport system ATP-binding protein